jgi:hypothetical protein
VNEISARRIAPGGGSSFARRDACSDGRSAPGRTSTQFQPVERQREHAVALGAVHETGAGDAADQAQGRRRCFALLAAIGMAATGVAVLVPSLQRVPAPLPVEQLALAET